MAEGDALMGDTPATRLRGGPGEEEGEGLDRELRHLETEEGMGVQADKFTFNLKTFTHHYCVLNTKIPSQ